MITLLSLALLVPVGPLGLVPAARAAEGDGLGRPDVPETRASEVHDVTGLGTPDQRELVADSRAENIAQAEAAEEAQQAAGWPAGGTAGVDEDLADVGGLPVSLDVAEAQDAEPRITVHGQDAARATGITGVLLSVDPGASAPARLRLDYRDFAGTVGGGWAARLGLVALPACALTTPDQPECRERTPLAADNDRQEGLLTADIEATGATEPLLLAVTASAPGVSDTGEGDYSATPLAESSSWEAGGSSGAFTWSYELTPPPVAAGPVPALSLDYDSGSVDGRTATTNNQGGLVGEGFSLTESYIERSYSGCDEDGHDDVYDRCWNYDNAQLVLNGSATRLVKDDETGRWRLENDDASSVTRTTGAANGDDNGEYWTVVTGDGTKYVFGQNELPGAGADQRTNSVWTAPVFGDDSGEPGYDRGNRFADRAVTQAWRWNLDYVEDTHGNVMTYWYVKETNHYNKNDAETANAAYTRGGYLSRIEYGQRVGALFSRDAEAEVRFTYTERCTEGDCEELTEDTSDHWPDVPYDALCGDGDEDCTARGPTFFSRKRLTGISTHSWNAANGAYDPVDSWSLVQDFLDPGDIGDTTDNVLVLTSVTHTGRAGDAIALSPVRFTYHMRPNRVDAVDDILPITRPRLNTITSETGGITTVTYSELECVRADLADAAEDTNTRNCFPQYWHVNGAPETTVDWFHKYRVTAVVEADPSGHSEPVEHRYSYTAPAWAYNDSPLVPRDDRTWSQWRGYGRVTTQTGNDDATRSRATTAYFQGLNGDRRADGSTRTARVTAIALPGLTIPDVTDRAEYAGMPRQSITYSGDTPISADITDPWSRTTATQDVPDARDIVARYVRAERTTTHTYLTAANRWRSRATTTTYDDYGMAATEEDTGDLAVTGDETCTRTWYARNPDRGITALTSRTRTVGRTCGTAETSLVLPTGTTTRGDVLADTATVYDAPDATAWTASQTPTRGLATWTGRPTGYRSTASGGERHPTGWQTTTRVAFDALGRETSTTDTAGNTSTTTYVPAGGGPVTRISTRNALGHTTHQFFDPRRGQPTRAFDANSRLTETTYDALGRLTAVWLPNRLRGGGASASQTFGYDLSTTRPSAVATRTLRADGTTYDVTYEIFDALLRPLQTQAPTPTGGRLLTDTRYNSLGQAYETFADIFDPSTEPQSTYARAEYGEAPRQENVVFDGAGRETSRTLRIFGATRWTTATQYTGDSVATTAVAGGTATRTITNARGDTVETRRYNGPSPADPAYGTGPGTGYVATEFTHTLDGKLSTVAAPEGARWAYGYDLHGREITSSDPDKGDTTKRYNALDQLVSLTDADGDMLLTAYDALGRPTGTWQDEISTATRLTGYTYDQLARGHLDSSTRYTAGRAYTRAITEYDSLYRTTGSELRLPADDPLVASEAAPQVIPLSSAYRIDGTLGQVREPALGGLPSEIVAYGYTNGVVTRATGATGYLLDADYSALGQIQQLTLGTANTSEYRKVYVTNTYEEGTGRLTRRHVTDQTHPYMLQDLNYAYDDAGNVRSITDPTTLGGTSAADNQCFTYDGQRRLTHAWTPRNGDCATANRTTAALGGAAPYWTSWTYDDAGSRTAETEHTTSGTRTTTYCYTDADRPHAATGTSPTADCASPTAEYAYDATGNTISRPGPAGEQTLTWSLESHLTQVRDGSTTTDYVYDAEGTLLIRRSPNGDSVLYAGGTELHVSADGDTWAQRTYFAGETTLAVRNNESGREQLFYLSGDHHGTQGLAVGATDQAVVRRFLSPFGTERNTGTTTDWVDDKSFLGKPTDTTTGLTQVGARQYDPAVGRFLSVDPMMDLTDSDQLHGYAYANNNPVSYTDPSGTMIDTCWNGGYNCDYDGRGGITNVEKQDKSGWGNGGGGGRGGGGGGGVEVAGPYAPPPAGSEDANRAPWGSEDSTLAERGRFMAVQSLMLGYMAFEGYGNATALLDHWFNNSGQPMEVQVEQMLEDLERFRGLVDEEVRAHAGDGRFDTGWQSTSVGEQIDRGGDGGHQVRDWYYALNGFQYRVQGAVEIRDGEPVGVIVVDVYKRYNWGNPAGGQPRNDVGVGPARVSQNELASYNTLGLAQDFDVMGRQVIEWGG
ncbi:RHS repeat-associated core domain-containing protein [Streptomyces sp. NPDC127098]|uniref:RHS repeat domain-containing protein n=1 Tax=Streptomyces sp. NPDC127098 TaxID=3347137 RepID=UPI00365200F6